MQKYFQAGTHRACSPAQTLEKIRPYMAQMGITRVANITGLDHIGIPVVTVCRPNARALSVAQGKGIDLDSAKASGVMEAMESYLAEHMTLPLTLASTREMQARGEVIALSRLPKLSTLVYQEDMSLLWVEGQRLGRPGSVWLPYDLVHTNYTLPLPQGSGAFMMTTNGLASGNTRDEALIHGLCELIERDATSLWQLGGGADGDVPMLDLDSVTSAMCNQVLQRYRDAEMDVGVWDTSTDLGVASFYCTIIDKTDNPLRPLYPASGAGCHPNREVALLRALTEAAQTRLTLMSGSRDDTGLDDYQGLQDKALQTQIRRWLAEPNAKIQYAQVVNFDADTFEQDIAFLLQRLAHCGIDTPVFVDLSQPEFDIQVVRVVAAGLEGISDLPGYSPGERGQAVIRKKKSDMALTRKSAMAAQTAESGVVL